MTAVYVLRHPETTWNKAQRYQGRLEAPLSDKGREQAEAVVDAFAGERLDAVYSSPLLRARQLAQGVAAATRTSLTVDQRLTELGQCPWEGRHLDEIKATYDAMYHQWYDRPDTVHFPGGESLQDVKVRAESALTDIYLRHPKGHVAVVTHSVVIHVLVAAASGLDLQYIHRMRVSNGGVTTFCGAAWPAQLLTVNDTSALYQSPVSAAREQGCGTEAEVTRTT